MKIFVINPGSTSTKIALFEDDQKVWGTNVDHAAEELKKFKEIADQLISQGFISGRPSLGLSGEAVSSFYQFYYRLPSGMYIESVDAQSDAYQKGLEPGDILISVDSVRVTSTAELETLLSNYSVGDTVQIVIYRAGRQYSAQLTLHEAMG